MAEAPKHTRWLDAVTAALGSVAALVVVVAIVVVWAAAGPFLHFSEPWQLCINTATTIITFIMVFVIQNTTNRSDRAMHAKLDELVRALRDADTGLVGIEEMAERDIRDRQTQVREKADRPES